MNRVDPRDGESVAASPQAECITQEQQGWVATARVRQADRLAIELEGIQWEPILTDALRPRSTAAWAQRLAANLKGLREPLQVVEVDPTSQQALLRSDRPTPELTHRSYYELRIHSEALATLKRYLVPLESPQSSSSGSPAGQSARRQETTFVLTREVLQGVLQAGLDTVNES